MGRDGKADVEPALALVHLAEHLAIDVIAFVAALESVSGVTAALESSETRFDLFVEATRLAADAGLVEGPWEDALRRLVALGVARPINQNSGERILASP